MAIDQVGIYNLAVLLVGGSKLTSPTGTSKEARLARTLFDFSAYGMHALPIDWRFATSRAQLSRLTATPAFGPYDYQYLLPSSLVRVIAVVDVDDDDTQYEYDREVYVASDSTEKEVVLVNELTCYIKYIRYRVNIGTWPAWFARLVALDLAILMCEPLKQDKRKVNQLYALLTDPAKGWLARAIQANAMENARTNDNNENLNAGNDDVLNASVMGVVKKRYKSNTT